MKHGKKLIAGVAAILWRYAGSPSAEDTGDFADEGEIASYAQAALILYRYLISGQENASSDGTPVVYMTTDISPEGLMAVYRALGVQAEGERIAVKLSTGEPGSNCLRPELIQDLVQEVDGTVVECNTAYGGSRANTAIYYQVAEDHGYTAIADVDIMDEDGSLTLLVVGGSNLTENYVGTHFSNYDYFVVLSHFKGHSMAGFGGAIKNISIGIASANWPLGMDFSSSGVMRGRSIICRERLALSKQRTCSSSESRKAFRRERTVDMTEAMACSAELRAAPANHRALWISGREPIMT